MLTHAHNFVYWMRHTALLCFLEQGVKRLADGALCFRETLPDDGVISRSRVQTRQLYVYAHATRTGWLDARDTLDSVAKRGLTHFTNAQGVFFFSDGDAPAMAQLNTYEQAFALLAYSELYALTRKQQFLNRAEKLHDWMKTHLALSEGGYAADVTRPAMLDQNPNMHLFEAMLSWWQITGSPRWEKEAHNLSHLFSEHLFHRERHCLTEFFASGWQADPAYSMQVDPGHHHEWTWLLYQYEKLASVETAFWRDALQNFAATAGENPLTQAMMNEVYSDKTPYRAGSRLWCQTERVKADVVACITRRDATALQRLENHVATMMRQYITGESGRVFCDEISDMGERLAHSSPASTLYHLYIVCREVDSLLKAQTN